MKEEDDKSEMKILGLNWDTMSDELRFEFVIVMEFVANSMGSVMHLNKPLQRLPICVQCVKLEMLTCGSLPPKQRLHH